MTQASSDTLTSRLKMTAPLRLADAVSEAIATALFDGRIAPGDALPSEGEIAREFRVSKPIAREAMRQLSGVGLVHVQQGKVARAKALTGESLDRIYSFAVRSSLERLREANEMRRVIETGIAHLAAQRQSPVGIRTMHDALSAMHVSLGVPGAFTEADMLFHHGIALATGNSMVRVQMEGMRSIHREVANLFTNRANRTEADWKATIARHKAVLVAIVSKKAGSIDKAMREHFAAADLASLEVAVKADQ